MEVMDAGSDMQLVLVGDNGRSGDREMDICRLFSHYNALYFDDSLAACTISWITRRTALAGIEYNQKGACEIYLSEPLLKPRSSVDVKNVTLHEMIHAYMWVKNGIKNRSNHGPRFQELVRKIHSNLVADFERPDGGYNVTSFHTFKHVDSHKNDICSNDSSKRILACSKGMDKSSDSRPKRSGRSTDSAGAEAVVMLKKCNTLKNLKPSVSHIWTPYPVPSRRKRTPKVYSDQGPGPNLRMISADTNLELKQQIIISGKSGMSKNDFNKEIDLKAKIRQNNGSPQNSRQVYHFVAKRGYGEEDEIEDQPLVNKRTERRNLERMMRDARYMRVEEDIQPIQVFGNQGAIENEVISHAVVVFTGSNEAYSHTSNVVESLE